MGDKSQIQWTDATWNMVTGCDKVSPGCARCYIERTPPFRMNGRKFERGTTGVLLHPKRLDWPLLWKKPRKIFGPSLGDLFHEDVPDEFILKTFTMMRKAHWHTFQILTKRPERMMEMMNHLQWHSPTTEQNRNGVRGWQAYLGDADTKPLPNVWLGVSAENQYWADRRIPLLLQTPAAVRFVSYEPALKSVNFNPWISSSPFSQTMPALDQIIIGGESGPKARRFDENWAHITIRDCRDAGIACFVKQMGSVWAQEHGAKDRKGGDMGEWPEALRVREFPKVTP